MVAIDAGMDLERHPVIKAHPRHFGEHLRAEQLGLSRREIARPHLGVEPFGIGAIEIGGGGAGVSVIGRGRAPDLAEIGAAVLVSAQSTIGSTPCTHTVCPYV